MKACPVCHARTFDDAEVCYGCMHRYEDVGVCSKVAVGNVVWEPDEGVPAVGSVPLPTVSPAPVVRATQAVSSPQASGLQGALSMRSVQSAPIPVGRHALILKDVDNHDSLHQEADRLQGAYPSVLAQGDDVRRGRHVSSAGAEQEESRLVDCISFDGAGWAVRVEFAGREECDAWPSMPKGARSPNVSAGALPSSSTESLAGSLPLTIHICPTFDADHKARRLPSERGATSVSCCTEKDYAKQVVGP